MFFFIVLAPRLYFLGRIALNLFEVSGPAAMDDRKLHINLLITGLIGTCRNVRTISPDVRQAPESSRDAMPEAIL